MSPHPSLGLDQSPLGAERITATAFGMQPVALSPSQQVYMLVDAATGVPIPPITAAQLAPLQLTTAEQVRACLALTSHAHC